MKADPENIKKIPVKEITKKLGIGKTTVYKYRKQV